MTNDRYHFPRLRAGLLLQLAIVAALIYMCYREGFLNVEHVAEIVTRWLNPATP